MTLDGVISDILRREGWPKVTDHPADKGGLTRGGVTFTSYNRWLASRGRPTLTAAQFIEITESEAREFFAEAFAGPFRFVDDEPIFAMLADWSVNAGPDDPARALQVALKARGHYTGAIDGVAGPMTRAGWAALVPDCDGRARLLYDLVVARVEFHFDRGFDVDTRRFVKATATTQLVFLRGWTLRALEGLRPDGSR